MIDFHSYILPHMHDGLKNFDMSIEMKLWSIMKINLFLTYIHLNPMRAKMIIKPEEYKWSSYRIFPAIHNIIG